MTARARAASPHAKAVERRTRVYRRPYGRGPYFVSLQVSFTDAEAAHRFSRAVDAIKAQAACEGLSLSRRLLVAVESAAAQKGARRK